MSGLADLLAGRTPAGVHLWPSSAPVAEVAEVVRAAGWRFVHLDGGSVATREQFLIAVGEVFGFPETYGHNFDAFADLLYDVGRADGRGTVLLWDGWDVFAQGDERWFTVARAILAERASDPGAAPLVVLLRDLG